MHLGLAFGSMALLLLLPDAYIFFGPLRYAKLWVRLLFLLPTLIYMLTLAGIFLSGTLTQTTINWVFWLTLCIFFPIMIYALVSLAGKCLLLFWSGAPHFFDRVALAASLLWLCGALYGIAVGWKKVTVERETLTFSTLPEAFDGYRIVHLSDLHIGTYAASPRTVQRIVDEVNALEPDLIVFTGDMVNNHPEEIHLFAGELARLQATDGVLAVLGNHDYCLYRTYVFPETPDQEAARVVAAEEAVGWHVLRNESVKITRGGAQIAVLGVENAGSKSFPDHSDLRRAMTGVPDGVFSVLLSHDPSHWRREVLPKTGIPLMLAGHTHAMQFRLGDFSPAQWNYTEWGGVYREGGQTLVVNTGTGGNVAFRFGAYPQILLLTLRAGAAE